MKLDDSTQLNSAREAISRGDKKTAETILAGILKNDVRNADAWLLMADILENPDHRIECLKRVLQINPNNVIAKARLQDMSRLPEGKQKPAFTHSSIQPVRKSKKKSSNIIVIGIIALALCGCIAFAFFVSNIKGTPSSTPFRPTSTEASIICEQFITNRLKAPSTAKFSSYDEDRIYTLTDKVNGYRVVGWVDAQNSFGAQLRSQYTCEIQYNSGDWADITNWTLLYLDIQ